MDKHFRYVAEHHNMDHSKIISEIKSKVDDHHPHFKSVTQHLTLAIEKNKDCYSGQLVFDFVLEKDFDFE